MSCWALIPMKRRDQAKSRLMQVLDSPARLALVRAMLGHVLRVVGATPGIDHIAVVSAERDTVPENIVLLEDAGRGLNRALGAAVATLKATGARKVVIVAGDLPHLEVTDVTALLAGLCDSGCVVAGDESGQGTNAISLDLERLDPIAFRFLFGRNSFGRHVRQAQALGLGPQIIQRPGLWFDLDEPEALNALMVGQSSELEDAS